MQDKTTSLPREDTIIIGFLQPSVQEKMGFSVGKAGNALLSKDVQAHASCMPS